jgi:hypothetical protein
MSDVLSSVTEALYSKRLIPFGIKDKVMTAQGIGVGNNEKAIYLVHVLDGLIQARRDPNEYLINICHVLIDQHHQPLTDVANTILHQLGVQSNTNEDSSSITSE